MPSTDLEVRRADPDDDGAASVVLARAFLDDPLYAWAFPDPRRRARRLPGWMRALTLTMYRSMGPTDVAVVDGYVVGVAVWADPGHLEPDTRATLRAVPGVVGAVGLRGLRGFVVLDEALASIRPAEPHRYLFHLGTDPGWWGRGVGSGLVGPRLAEGDAEGVSTYLECKPANIPYYERFGFAVTERVPFEPVELWGMLRPPAPSHGPGAAVRG